ncbi:MAG: right-handed parallel beta-helix repeat-containing protein [Halodesulfurarchaeum sp.]
MCRRARGRRSVLIASLCTVVVVSLFVLVVLASTPAVAQDRPAFVEENVTQNTTWTAEGGPYRVVENVTVTNNSTLTIDAGTEVQVAEGVSIRVQGTLFADGSRNRPVVFTSAKRHPGRGAWGSLVLAGTGQSSIRFDQVRIEYPTTGILIPGGSGSVAIHDSSIRHAARSGIRASAGTGTLSVSVIDTSFRDLGEYGIAARPVNETAIRPTVDTWRISDSSFVAIGSSAVFVDADSARNLFVLDNTVERARTGVRVTGDFVSAVSIRGNSIHAARSGISVVAETLWDVDLAENVVTGGTPGIEVAAEPGAWGVSIRGNRIVDGGTGIRLTRRPGGANDPNYGVTVRENRIAGNDGYGLHLVSGTVRNTSLEVRNNTIVDNGRSGVSLETQALTDTTLSGNTIRHNGWDGISISADRMRDVVLTRNRIRSNRKDGVDLVARRTMRDVTVRNNRLLDNGGIGLSIRTGIPSGGTVRIADNLLAANAYGLRIVGPQRTFVRHNDVVFNTVGFESASPIQDVRPGTGVFLRSVRGNVSLTRNDVYGNEIGLVLETRGTVQAESNFWGAPSGPYHQSINPAGSGNPVVTRSGWVDVTPVLSAPVGPRRYRPDASLSVSHRSVAVGEAVTLKAVSSSDRDGRVTRYRFSIEGRSASVTGNAIRRVSFDEPGTYRVSVRVEDGMGIESDVASATVSVHARQTTSQATETPGKSRTTTGANTTPPQNPPEQEDGPLPALLSISGLIGLILYLGAVGLGVLGMYQTVTERSLTVRGRRIQVIAIAGILLWAVGGFLGPPALLRVSAFGLVVWVLGTGISYLIAKGA